jgi:transposase
MPDRDKRKGSPGSPRQIEGLPVVRHKVAGIDLGSERHWVCAPMVDGSGREVADFGATTPELIRMAQWLKARKVESVAMESTGVYWIAPHEVLEAEGLEVMLVDTRQLARVPGRNKKSDPWKLEEMEREECRKQEVPPLNNPQKAKLIRKPDKSPCTRLSIG